MIAERSSTLLTYTLAIVGSRTFGECACWPTRYGDFRGHSKGCRYPEDWALVLNAIVRVQASRPDLRVVSGAAHGADSLAAFVARHQGIPLQEIPADWSQGKGAGFARNQLIVNAADAILAFFGPGPKTRGTLDTIRRAIAAGKPTASHHHHQWTRETS